MFSTCGGLIIHSLIFDSLGIGKYLLKFRIKPKYLMKLDFNNGTWFISCFKPSLWKQVCLVSA